MGANGVCADCVVACARGALPPSRSPQDIFRKKKAQGIGAVLVVGTQAALWVMGNEQFLAVEPLETV